MEAQDVMTTGVISIKADNTVAEVIKILAENKISGVPVVNDAEQVIGIISEGDLVLRDSDLRPMHYFSFLNDVLEKESNIDFEQAKMLLRSKVSALMVKDVITAKAKDSIEKVANLMANKKVNRIPIVDDDNKLVGIIARSDLIKTYLKACCNCK